MEALQAGRSQAHPRTNLRLRRPTLPCSFRLWTRSRRCKLAEVCLHLVILNQLLDLRPESVQPRQGPLSSIDLFAGAGGLSIGLERAGFAIVSAVAWLPDRYR